MDFKSLLYQLVILYGPFEVNVFTIPAMFYSNRFPVFLILMFLCLLHALVESSPIIAHHGEAVHHGNISSTVPLYYEENPTPIYITVTKTKSDEINDANPDELNVLFKDLTNSVRSASNFFQENRPSDAIATLATSHIIDFNGVLADAGKKILAQNATLKQSADDMFTKLNMTFSDENTKHQMFVALGVGGVTAGGLAIEGMMTREVFEQNDVLKWTFKAYNMAKRSVALGEAKDIPEGLEVIRPELARFGVLLASLIIDTVLFAGAVIILVVKEFSQVLTKYLLSASFLTFAALSVFIVFLCHDSSIGGVILNNSDEDFTSGSVYVKHGDMKNSPSLFIPKAQTFTYLNAKNEPVSGEGKNLATFAAVKHDPSIFGTTGAISYQNKDGSRKYIFAWHGQQSCNVASSGTGKDLVDSIGDSLTVKKKFPGGNANCTLTSTTDTGGIVRFVYNTK